MKRQASELPSYVPGDFAVVIRRLALGILVTDVLMLVISPAWLGAAAVEAALFRGAVAFLPFAVAAVVLAYRGRTDLAAHLIVGGVFVGAWLFMPLHLGRPTDPYVLMGIAYTPFLAGFLLSPAATGVYSIATLAGVSSLRVFSPAGASVTPNVFLFATVFGGLSVWAAFVRTQWAAHVIAAQEYVNQSQRELDALFHASHEGQAFMDQAGRILQANDRLAEMFGMRAIGRMTPIQDVLPQRLHAPYMRHVADCLESGVTRWSFRLAGPTSHNAGREIQATLVPVESADEGPMVLMTCHDITDLVQAHAEKDAAVQEARTRALNLISHHLRTPITPLRLDLFALRARGDNLTPVQRGTVERMERDLGRLTSMLDLLVEASRVNQEGRATAGPPRSDPVRGGISSCDVQRILADALDGNAHAPVQNDALAPAEVLCDPLALRVAFDVLLERLDPAKHWRAWTDLRPGSVRLNFATGEPSDAEVSVELGEPFAADTDDTVFRDQLAMFVVRSSIEATGGRVDAFASPTGQRVCLTLPAARSSPGR